jgi:hypothetical protein
MIDASTMLGTFMQSFPGFEMLLNLGVALLGVCLTGMALFKFVELGKPGGHPGGVTWVTPAMYLVSGAALWNFGSSVNVFLETLYGPSTSVSNLLGYSGSSSKMPPETKVMLTALIACIRLYGYFTFARAWMSVRKIGSGQNGSDEVFKGAVIRLFAGVALINIVQTTNWTSGTFGFGDVL